jgi:uncharacterized protein (DUF58 family)
VLTQRNVYILPTGAGWLFAALLLTLLLASINYQLNLGYLLTFVLAGVGLSSMHTTHATLRGLQLRAQTGEPVFAGEAAALQITLGEPAPTPRPRRGWPWRGRPRARHGIGLRLRSADRHAAPADPGETGWSWVDVPAGTTTQVHLSQLLPTRGWHPAGRVAVETRFPFGLFRAWTVWRPAARWLAWPAPETPAAPLPWSAATPGGQHSAGHSTQAMDDPGGVRAWRRGDSLTTVQWKKSAQSLASDGGLVSRDTGGQPPAELLLDWAWTAGSNGEQRIARLTAWVLAAEQAGLPYALRLAGQELPAGLGTAQRHEALLRLATWGAPAAPTQGLR